MKDGLRYVFDNYLRPTLHLIEKAAKEKLKTNYIMTSGQYQTHISLETLEEIRCSENDLKILRLQRRGIRHLYDMYLCPDFTADHGLKGVLKMLKDFGISPYLLT